MLGVWLWRSAGGGGGGRGAKCDGVPRRQFSEQAVYKEPTRRPHVFYTRTMDLYPPMARIMDLYPPMARTMDLYPPMARTMDLYLPHTPSTAFGHLP